MEHERPHVVIVGGAMIGTSIAWWLSADPEFDGTVTVIERDPTYATASTSHTNSCIRQQFSNPLNIAISQFGLEFIRGFRSFLGDPDIPDIFFDEFGYLYLADDDATAAVFERKQTIQRANGSATELLGADAVARRWPFINASDIRAASFGPRGEGYFDSGTMFSWLRRVAKRNGVGFVHDTVTGIERAAGPAGERATGVVLASGERLASDWVVNAAGPRAASVAAMVGVELPVEPRKRYSWVFRCATDLGGVLPLTIDPSGVHVRSDGDAFLVGGHADDDPAVAVDDFTIDPDIFDDLVWPTLVHRVPAFEQIKVINAWAGHYAYNTLDQNAILGPLPQLPNFLLANGFSGHGLQQSPAVGRGIAEWIIHGAYTTLDLTPLGYQRVVDDEPFAEANVI